MTIFSRCALQISAVTLSSSGRFFCADFDEQIQYLVDGTELLLVIWSCSFASAPCGALFPLHPSSAQEAPWHLVTCLPVWRYLLSHLSDQA
jgi:hypothetical protein